MTAQTKKKKKGKKRNKRDIPVLQMATVRDTLQYKGLSLIS
jgi:hypothetical protein